MAKLIFKRVVKHPYDGRKRAKLYKYADSIKFVDTYGTEWWGSTKENLVVEDNSSSFIEFYNKNKSSLREISFLACVTAPVSHIEKTKYQKGNITREEFNFFYEIMKNIKEIKSDTKTIMYQNLLGYLSKNLWENIDRNIIECIDIFENDRNKMFDNDHFDFWECEHSIAKSFLTSNPSFEIIEKGISYFKRYSLREANIQVKFFSKIDYNKHKKSIDAFIQNSPRLYFPVLQTKNLSDNIYKLIADKITSLSSLDICDKDIKVLLNTYEFTHKEKLDMLKKNPDMSMGFLEADEIHPDFIEVMQKKGDAHVGKVLKERELEVIEIKDISIMERSSFISSFTFEYFHNNDLSKDILENIFLRKAKWIEHAVNNYDFNNIFEELLKKYEDNNINITEDIPTDIILSFVCRKYNMKEIKIKDYRGYKGKGTNKIKIKSPIFEKVKNMLQRGIIQANFTDIENFFDNIRREDMKDDINMELVDNILNTLRSKLLGSFGNMEYNMDMLKKADSALLTEKVKNILYKMEKNGKQIDKTILFLRNLSRRVVG